QSQRRAKVYVQSDQRPLAIGKQGQNVRLASILTGWEIDVLDVSDHKSSVESVAKEKEKVTVKTIAELKIDPAIIEKLAAANLTLVEQIKGLSAKDLSGVDGIDEAAAKAIVDAVKGA
ncbi:MAG: hypothetical protein WC873_00005, partial [Candidatus Gracilibacteria bacterium]